MIRMQNQKMKNCIFNLIIFISIFLRSSVYAFEIGTYEKKIKNNYNITSVTEKISREALEKNLRDFLSSGRPSRFVGTEGHEKALLYLEEKLKSFKSKGAGFEKIEFTPNISKAKKLYADKDSLSPMAKILESVKNIKGHNLIWEKKGAISSETIILGANYDTILIDPKSKKVESVGVMPGADNNATGVIALLSMIEILDKLDLPKTVRVIFFDFEELGFLGSRDYADKLKTNPNSQKILGYINLVMLGNDSKREDKEKKLNNMKIYLRSPDEKGADDDLKLKTLVVDNGKRLYGQINFSAEANRMNFGSQVSFWEAGIPAICMSQNWESDLNPRFHTPNDFVETLNINTYTNAFRYITSAVLAWNYDVVK